MQGILIRLRDLAEGSCLALGGAGSSPRDLAKVLLNLARIRHLKLMP